MSDTDVTIFMSLHLGDRIRETGDLSPAEYGVHVRLCEASWTRGGYLTADPDRLCRLAGADLSTWTSLWNPISALWTPTDDGRIYHAATLAAIERARAIKTSLAERGRKGREAQLAAGPKPATARPEAGNGPATARPSELRDPDSGSPNTEHRTPNTRSGVGAEVPADGRSPPAPAEVSLLDFVTRGKVKTWSFTQSKLDELSEAFPDLDILATAKQARAWLAAKPRRTKTAEGMPAFLYRWISNEQNGPRTGKPGNGGQQHDIRIGRVAAESCSHSAETGPVDMDAVLKGGQA